MKGPGKKLMKAVCAVGAALSLAACGASPGAQQVSSESGFVPALDPAAECEVRFVGNYNNFESLEAEFDRFNEIYPNVGLSYTVLDNYNETVSAALAAEDAPDIFCLFPWMYDKDPFGPLFDAAEDLSEPSLNIDLGCIREGLLFRDGDGRVPLVPVFSSSVGMLVNEDLFAREGVEIPTTYSGLLAACGTLKDAGYPGPVISYNSEALFCHPMAYPFFCASIQGDAEAVERLNALEPAAGAYLCPMLELVQDFMGHGYMDLETCNALEDSYQALILRFFEGDIPMMFVNGDIVSGTAKRESLSQTFTEHPFVYSFHPIPTTEEGGYFLNTVSQAFAVNRNSGNLDMANEFMRFLVSTGELNEMARVKRLLTPSTDLSFDGVYAAFGKVDAAHTLYDQKLGMLDAPIVQMRRADWQVANGNMSVDEAIAAFGTME